MAGTECRTLGHGGNGSSLWAAVGCSAHCPRVFRYTDPSVELHGHLPSLQEMDSRPEMWCRVSSLTSGRTSAGEAPRDYVWEEGDVWRGEGPWRRKGGPPRWTWTRATLPWGAWRGGEGSLGMS